MSRGQGVTHGNQAGIAERVDETDRKLGELLAALSAPNVGEALKTLKVH